mgnify:CR=1 FL=1
MLYQKHILARLNELRKAEILCDVILTTDKGEKRIPVHRLVLAASSSYFNSFFTGTSLARFSRETSLSGISDEALEIIIDYIYSSKVLLTEDNIRDLLRLSSEFHLEYLKQECERFILKLIDCKNCLELRMLAGLYNCKELLSETRKFISRNFNAVRTTKAFHFISVDLLLEIISDEDLHVNTEDQVYEALSSWLNFDYKSRISSFPALLRVIRLPYLDRKLLTNEVEFDARESPQSQKLLSETMKNITACERNRTLMQSLGTNPRYESGCHL